MTKNKQTLVSVYIPTHNRRELLERALNSILKQTYQYIEIIVCDDGSSDNTESFMRDFIKKYPTIKYLKNLTPKGANVARNRAIKESKGDLITGFDDDDEMFPFYIEKLVKAYDDKYAFVYSGYKVQAPTRIVTNTVSKNFFSINEILNFNYISNQVLTTKEMYIEAGLFDERMVACQDYDMWIRLLKIKPFAKALQEPLFIMYTNHARISNSNNHLKGNIQWFLKHKHMLTKRRRKELVFAFRLSKKRKINFKDKIFIKLNNIYKRFFISNYLKTSIEKLN